MKKSIPCQKIKMRFVEKYVDLLKLADDSEEKREAFCDVLRKAHEKSHQVGALYKNSHDRYLEKRREVKRYLSRYSHVLEDVLEKLEDIF